MYIHRTYMFWLGVAIMALAAVTAGNLEFLLAHVSPATVLAGFGLAASVTTVALIDQLVARYRLGFLPPATAFLMLLTLISIGAVAEWFVVPVLFGIPYKMPDVPWSYLTIDGCGLMFITGAVLGITSLGLGHRHHAA